MAYPEFGGVLSSDASGVAAAVIDLSAVPTGAWMVGYMVVAGSQDPAAPPSGWTALTPAFQDTGSRRSGLIGKIKQAGDSGLSWALAGGVSQAKRLVLAWGTGGGPVNSWIIGKIGVRGSANVVAGQSVVAGTATTSVAPSITVPAETQVVSILMEATSAAGAFTLSSGEIKAGEITEITGFIEQVIVARSAPAAGATTDVTATAVATQASNGLGVQIGITPTTGGAVPAGTLVKLGTGASAHAQYTDAAGVRHAPASMRPWLPGFAAVDAMLAKSGATWAHRGGSSTWPEMSEWAYDQSVLRGYGVLEFSAQRSSDGWWFGLHDVDLKRTSPSATTTEVSTMTRAQIEAFQIENAPSGGPRPYYGMVEFLKKYGKTHVLVMDVKNASAHLTEFLDVIAANTPANRVIIKYYGVGSGAGVIADAARARGMKSWGYFYQTDYEAGTIATWAPKWDILGMNIAATTGWSAADGILSYGKPVVGHIAASQAEYDQAITKGATLVQCAGVAVIKPVSA